MVQRTVLKVDISCQKCKKKLLKAVSGLQGVDKIEIDGSKGTLTVTGDADPYEIIIRTKKVGKFVEVVSVGPPPPPPKPQQDGQKKPEEKKPDKKAQPQVQDHIHTPHSYPVCVVQVVRTWDEPNPSCSIM
ncbi:Heavy metal-associated isoprenylated plant protein [Actinidia chinensis var. chinensis]|uniref:Heavy metal-associated isoprenylated plant protein n=1 Tax=Actinidia chinensis var. chinensis TaxID=1590841 RepID=A0A2R6S2J5_ACTCC|nr:Heavy metal-associated isoprenylated plant protein [Actinidia chinensis var. chinensis]